LEPLEIGRPAQQFTGRSLGELSAIPLGTDQTPVLESKLTKFGANAKATGKKAVNVCVDVQLRWNPSIATSSIVGDNPTPNFPRDFSRGRVFLLFFRQFRAPHFLILVPCGSIGIGASQEEVEQ